MKQILVFSLPLVLGTLFQQLYSFADTVMVGRMLGSNALAAVGTTYSLNFLVLGFVQGACVGFAIPLAQSVGAKREDEFKRYFWNGCWLSLAMSLVFCVIAFFMAKPLLKLIQTPKDIFNDAVTYIQIIFLGIPATVLYNFGAGALRAAGDSQRPFYFLLFSSFLNIVLDYLMLPDFGVAGAAFATVFSQFVSGALNVYWLGKKVGLLYESKGFRGFSASHIKELSRVGFPMGFEYSVSAIGAVFMQSALNVLGTAAVAGQTAAEKIRQMFTLIMESVGMGMATYVGQNAGANRLDRIKDGIKAGLKIQLIYCVFAWIVIYFGKDLFTSFVLGPDAGEAGVLSVKYLEIISVLFCFHGSLMIMRNTLQGMGYSLQAVLSGVAELVGRGIGSYLTVKILGFTGICISNPLAWICALAYCSAMVRHFLKK